jgi:PQQ-dependent catabolism-associated CXXCW motif protein
MFATAAADVKEPDGYWTGPIDSPVPETITGGQVIHAQALANLIEAHNPVVIDVSNTPKRPDGMALDAPWLPLPHEAIPGSLWIPEAGMAEVPAHVDEFFREELSEATDGNLDATVVIYCHEQCWLSWNAAKRAISYGYRNVHWFPQGIEGWRAAGFKTEVMKPRLPPQP